MVIDTPASSCKRGTSRDASGDASKLLESSLEMCNGVSELVDWCDEGLFKPRSEVDDNEVKMKLNGGLEKYDQMSQMNDVIAAMIKTKKKI